ncbi:cysteine desulfurase family protein [Candidatus Synechococcus spongiarum]|uniref:cysteine desulfurase n=1 Tax=Candidatus Synechococcus spongiarum TaxID=431041 RepID=A0A171DGI1_9SYNE|nr:cysteine desulfurase family protein [Candidatus Synechococcus spongiarum]SAY38805.1 Cysteine desulfurase (EC 2.8.1.7) [Candidatus Synechococcus spongiarum]
MPTEPRLYLDGCATTPPSPGVRAAVAAAQEDLWGNPSSRHQEGRQACLALERSREQVAQLLDVPPDWVVFTSGGTEANHLAIHGVLGAVGGAAVCSAVEHPAVGNLLHDRQRAATRLELLRPDSQGRLSRASLLERLHEGPVDLVSVIGAQSEVGSLQPLATMGAICSSRGIPFHSDGVQLCGKTPLYTRCLGVDLLTISAHKFCGPKGIGALIRNPRLSLTPLHLGGGQESGLRSGTPAVPLAVGFGVAAQEARRALEQPSVPLWHRWTRQLREQLWSVPGIEPTGHPEDRLPGHISCLVGTPGGEPLEGSRVVRALDGCGYAVSSGSACRSGSAQPSTVLLAMGIDPARARSGLRLCLGPWLCGRDTAVVEDRLRELPQVVRQLCCRLAPLSRPESARQTRW